MAMKWSQEYNEKDRDERYITEQKASTGKTEDMALIEHIAEIC